MELWLFYFYIHGSSCSLPPHNGLSLIPLYVCVYYLSPKIKQKRKKKEEKRSSLLNFRTQGMHLVSNIMFNPNVVCMMS